VRLVSYAAIAEGLPPITLLFGTMRPAHECQAARHLVHGQSMEQDRPFELILA
jgi:hypothetical protein